MGQLPDADNLWESLETGSRKKSLPSNANTVAVAIRMNTERMKVTL